MESDTAADMARQGYQDKSATITLYSDNTFSIARIPDAWIGGIKPSGYDTFSGTWSIQKNDSRQDEIIFIIRKLDPGSAWTSPDMWYESFKRDGMYSFPVNITRPNGEISTYALALPIMGMDDQGYLVFVRQKAKP